MAPSRPGAALRGIRNASWLSPWSAGERRLDAGKEQPRDQQAHPDHEAEQADEIDRGQFADAFRPQPLEVRQDADREERQDEEDDAEGVGLADRGGHLGRDIRRRAEHEIEASHEGDDEADDELRKTLPDLMRLGRFASGVDVVGPDVAQHEGPDPDEDVDEYLDRRGGAEDPAGLILHTLGGVLRENK